LFDLAQQLGEEICEFGKSMASYNKGQSQFKIMLNYYALAEPPLIVELAPHTCWFSNVRDRYP
jgi:hypothetical protein